MVTNSTQTKDLTTFEHISPSYHLPADILHDLAEIALSMAMPIAVNMYAPDAASPTSPRMTKAAFFRARSPPVLDRTSATGTARAHSPNDLAARFHQMELNNNGAGPSRAYSPVSSGEDERHGQGERSLKVDYQPQQGVYASSVGTAGHTPEMASNGVMPVQGGGVAYDQPEISRRGEQEGIGGSSDEMLMSLLAGQAVMDCEGLVVGGWEEVESWKKVSQMPRGTRRTYKS